VRDPVEREIVEIPGSVNIAYEKIVAQTEKLDKITPLIFICRNGIRSERIVRKLRLQGFENAFNLKGGTNGWVKSIDPSQMYY